MIDRVRMAAWFPVTLWIASLVIITSPWPLTVIQPDFDMTWGAAINQAFLDRLIWGTQIIWTYGPFGFIDSTVVAGPANVYYYGTTWTIALVGAYLINAFYIGALAVYLVDLKRGWWTWAVAGGALLLPMMGALTAEYELLLSAILFLYLSVCSRWSRAYLFALLAGAPLALLLLIKGTGATACVAISICFLFLALLRRRWFAIVLFGASMAGFFCGLWSLTAPLSYLPAYFRSLYELTAGYSSAMQIFHEWTISTESKYLQLSIAWFVLIAAGLSVVSSAVKRNYRVLTLSLLTAPLLFVVYKEAYVRFTVRGPYFWAVVVMANLPILLQMRAVNMGWVSRLAPGSSMAVCGILLLGAGSVQFQTAWQVSPLSDTSARWSAYQQSLSLETDPTEQSRTEALMRSRFRAGYHFSPEFMNQVREGSIDSYPLDAAFGYAFNVNWDPRPTVQSYSAYTPYLDQADAAHYASRRGPRHVLFSYISADSRYPMFDEPATIRTILECYHVQASDDGFLLLARDGSSCVEPRMKRLSTVVAPLGSEISVPRASGPVYASVRVEDSVVGSLVNLAFQPSELHLRFQYPGGGGSGPYRWIPGTGPDGLLVSSHISNIADFSSVMSGHQVNPISSFQITAGRPVEYKANMEVDFYTLS